METGNLTPRSNNTVAGARYSGSFGPVNGFGSVLEVTINTEGKTTFTLHYSADFDGKKEHMWSVILDNEQRRHLSDMLKSYEPKLIEELPIK